MSGPRRALDTGALARRIHQLRTEHWPSVQVRQRELAEALGISAPTLSSWENEGSGKRPPTVRLRAIATFFASPRSVTQGNPRLLDDDELTGDELVERDRLLDELRTLRAAATGASSMNPAPQDPWLFPDGTRVHIVCGALNPADRNRFADSTVINYMALASFADCDALLELFGHVRALNPQSRVRYKRADLLESDDLDAHLVVIGNMGWAQGAGRVYLDGDIPIRQVPDPRIAEGEIFEIDSSILADFPAIPRDGRVVPEMSKGGSVREDVGLFVRTRRRSGNSLTICSGVFTSGVLGAVRTLTDSTLGESNSTYLAERFDDVETFAVLMRVPTIGRLVRTPNLRDERFRILEYPTV